MKNTAQVHIEDDAVCLIGYVKPNRVVQIIYASFIVTILTLYVLMMISLFNSDEPPKGGGLFMLVVVTPAMFAFFLVRPLLWNLFGKEEVRLKEKQIQHRRHYGIVTSGWRTEQYEPLFYEIESEQPEFGLSKIKFAGYTVMDVLFYIYSVAVYIPTEQLEILVRSYKYKFGKSFLSLNDVNRIEEYYEEHIYVDLENVNPNYPTDGMHFFAAEDVPIVLERIAEDTIVIVSTTCRNHVNEHIETVTSESYTPEYPAHKVVERMLATYPDNYKYSFYLAKFLIYEDEI